MNGPGREASTSLRWASSGYQVGVPVWREDLEGTKLGRGGWPGSGSIPGGGQGWQQVLPLHLSPPLHLKSLHRLLKSAPASELV